MLCWILIVGGLLIMMRQHDRSEALLYCVCLDFEAGLATGFRQFEDCAARDQE